MTQENHDSTKGDGSNSSLKRSSDLGMPLDTALSPSQVKRLNQWGITRRNGVKRAWSGHCSPRHAIKMQCLDCQGEDEQGIADCGDRCCPLWHFRPFQRKKAK